MKGDWDELIKIKVDTNAIYLDLVNSLVKLDKKFHDRYKSLSQLKGRSHAAAAAKRSHLDVRRLLKVNGLGDE